MSSFRERIQKEKRRISAILRKDGLKCTGTASSGTIEKRSGVSTAFELDGDGHAVSVKTKGKTGESSFRISYTNKKPQSSYSNYDTGKSFSVSEPLSNYFNRMQCILSPFSETDIVGLSHNLSEDSCFTKDGTDCPIPSASQPAGKMNKRDLIDNSTQGILVQALLNAEYDDHVIFDLQLVGELVEHVCSDVEYSGYGVRAALKAAKSVMPCFEISKQDNLSEAAQGILVSSAEYLANYIRHLSPASTPVDEVTGLATILDRAANQLRDRPSLDTPAQYTVWMGRIHQELYKRTKTK